VALTVWAYLLGALSTRPAGLVAAAVVLAALVAVALAAHLAVHPQWTGVGPVEAGAPAGLNRLVSLLPYGTLPVAVFVPLAAVLYLLTTTAWTALEHLVLRR
jgi:YidC/Oxa1 family membrane protein insertase